MSPPIRMANLTDNPTRLKSGTIVGYFQDAVFVSPEDASSYCHPNDIVFDLHQDPSAASFVTNLTHSVSSDNTPMQGASDVLTEQASDILRSLPAQTGMDVSVADRKPTQDELLHAVAGQGI